MSLIERILTKEKWITNKQAVQVIKELCSIERVTEHNHKLIDNIMYAISKVVET